MNRRPPTTTRTATLFPYTPLCRSGLIEPARGLRPGSTGNVILDLPGPGGSGVLVPRDALVYAQAAPWAYVETAPGHWQRRALDLSQVRAEGRSEEHTSELQSLMRISYAVCCLQKNKTKQARW